MWNFGYKAANAALHGAVGMIMVQDYLESSGDMLAGATLSSEYFNDTFPAVFADRAPIETALPLMPDWADAINTTMTPNSVATGVTGSIAVTAVSENVVTDNLIGYIPGSDPDIGDEVIVVGAHIDHVGTDPLTGEIYNGADDNASGTAVMMELARAMAAHDAPVARTVVFASWNAEEAGLIGSCFYVAYPEFPLAKTVAAYSVDMLGGGTGIGVGLPGASSAGQNWIAQVMSGSAEEIGLDYYVVPGLPTENSDHACFAYEGVDAVAVDTMIGTTGHENYHTPNDTIDSILLEDLEAGVLLMWAGMLPIAMGTEEQYLTSKATSSGGAPVDPSEYVVTPWDLWR